MSFAAVASSSVAAVTQTATFLKLKGGGFETESRKHTGGVCATELCFFFGGVGGGGGTLDTSRLYGSKTSYLLIHFLIKCITYLCLAGFFAFFFNDFCVRN